MDFYVEDEEGRIFDVEKQKRKEGNIPKRTRFYQTLIDAPMLKSEERGFDHLKPAYIVVICGFDQYGYGRYRYTFDNRCKEIPELVMGDECRKVILNTKGENEDETEKSLVDFLHYVEKSNAENVPENCDERLKDLHQKIHAIKSDTEMGVSYMKMEERDRLIREEGVREGKAEGKAETMTLLISMIRKKYEKGLSVSEIAQMLETEDEWVREAVKLLETPGGFTDREIAENIVWRDSGE